MLEKKATKSAINRVIFNYHKRKCGALIIEDEAIRVILLQFPIMSVTLHGDDVFLNYSRAHYS